MNQDIKPRFVGYYEWLKDARSHQRCQQSMELHERLRSPGQSGFRTPSADSESVSSTMHRSCCSYVLPPLMGQGP